MSGRYFIQHVTPSLTSGAGGTTPGGGLRRLLKIPPRSLLQAPVVNASTAVGQSVLTATNLNNFLDTGRRKLLQTKGLEIVYACAPTAIPAACLPRLARWASSARNTADYTVWPAPFERIMGFLLVCKRVSVRSLLKALLDQGTCGTKSLRPTCSVV